MGWDPSQGAPQLEGCPYYDDAVTIVWYEKWTITGWSAGNKTNTGIAYSHSFTAFDLTGQALPGSGGCNYQRGGFTGNQTGTKLFPPPTADDWLARARAAVAPLNLPPPGTIMLCPTFSDDIGVYA